MASIRTPGRTIAEDAAPQAETSASCPNCGQQFSGRYCSGCGEKRVEGSDYSLKNFLGEAFNILTSVESNFFRTFAALITKPGRLTAEYFAGRRKSYLKPLQLFLFCNVIFFFAQSYTGFNSLTTPLYVHTHMLPYSRTARALVERRLVERNISYEDYRARFDAAIENQAKSLVVVMVPLFALALHALYWRSRRYYVEHLVFATHFYAFFLLLVPAMQTVLTLALRGARALGFRLPAYNADDFYTIILLLICGFYLLKALRAAYGQGRTATFLKCLVLAACIIGVLQLYRFILFFTTFYST
ncbi:MAG TPA: DUF3667 domain-containing protein [Pyrinomonadaceae bacterium]|nr:DUF3667 domain-containing protein [Pyrinomonadaceae bacterium]